MVMRGFILAITLLVAVFTCGAAPGWESTDKNMTSAERAAVERTDNDGLDVWVREGYIYISAQRSVTVKIFSILGQLISQEAIPAGTYRLHLASRGIYILKAGTLTRRITL